MTTRMMLPPTEDEERYAQPIVLLPTQLPERARADRRPERDLVAAVLAEAIACYQRYALASDKRGRRLFHEAEAWLMDPAVTAAFRFGDVCDFLGIDADRLRAELARWRERLEVEASAAAA